MRKWRNPRSLGLPDSVYPELECDAPLDDDVDEEYRGRSSIVAGDYQGPSIPRHGTPPTVQKPKKAWAEPGGALEHLLIHALGVPGTYRQVIADSLRAAATGARIVDLRCDAECGDVIREWITGRG